MVFRSHVCTMCTSTGCQCMLVHCMAIWHGMATGIWHMHGMQTLKQILRATDDQETAVTGMNRAPGVCAAHMQI